MRLSVQCYCFYYPWQGMINYMADAADAAGFAFHLTYVFYEHAHLRWEHAHLRCFANLWASREFRTSRI